ncbi:AAA family ATPase [Bacillus safensis]|uniref:McrB family protein n=1 Tax=Bacillus safensis TaxID=561879 RepID=UPI00344BA8F7
MELNIYLVGVLALESRLKSFYPNLQPVRASNTDFNQFQFFLEVLNTDDIPYDYQNAFKNKFALGRSIQVKSIEWNDIAKDNFFNEEKFEEFASDKLFIFKPYIEETNYGEKNIKVSNNTLKIVDKPKGFFNKSPGGLITIPIFNDYNQYNFEKRLLSSQSISNYEFLDKITTSCVVAGSYIYGEFSNFEKLNDGWHFSIDEEIKKLPIDFEAYKDHLIIEPHAVYIDDEFFFDVILSEGLNKHGIKVSLNKEIKTKKIDEDIEMDLENDHFSEEDYLSKLLNDLSKEGLIFEKNQIINFHTALKTRRLVILSGPSGTGKTQLVYQYAKALGLIKKGIQQFRLIPVKPNWKDDTDLIGFLDTINNIYRPSDSGLLDILIEAKNNSDKLYLVCFDEMNLARVEHYFSQFLSVLELEGHERKISLYSKKMVGRVLNGEQFPHEVNILPNVLFVGTINNDETTETLSDKVLDRSNFIEFGIPENHINNWINSFTHDHEREGKIPSKNENETVNFHHYNNWAKCKSNIGLLPNEIDILNKINNILTKEDDIKGIGFRVLDHINSYMINLPENLEFSRSIAFDLQISQKIVPKIRGTIDELKDVLMDDENSLRSILDQTIFPITTMAIGRKVRELKLYGYTY